MKTIQFSKLASILILTSILFLANGCKKKATEEAAAEKLPSADFTFDKAQYNAGETINLTNTSSDATSFRWTLPNGTTSKSKDLSYPTSIYMGDALLQFKLEAFSKSGFKSDYTVQQIYIVATKGKLVLYRFSNWQYNPANYTLMIDGNNYGLVNIPYSTIVPTCNQEGYTTVELNVGNHVVTVTEGSFNTWNKTIEIKPSECNTVAIFE
jgi:hypothetical protein